MIELHPDHKHEPYVSSHQAKLLAAAAACHARGWSYVPLSGKVPVTSWKELQSRTPSPEELLSWFGVESRATGIGVVTGKVSGLVVVDCDSQQDAEFWQSEHGSSPLVVETGGGGVHFYYAASPLEEIRNRTGVLGRRIDIRGEGGYAAAPPSLHASGRAYQWRTCDLGKALPLFDAGWLVNADQERKLTATVATGRVRKAVAYIQKIEAVAGEGGHNATFRAACKLRDAGLSEGEALAVLSDWNQTNATPPWSERELAHKIASAYRAQR
jgi:hypothetical protein